MDDATKNCNDSYKCSEKIEVEQKNPKRRRINEIQPLMTVKNGIRTVEPYWYNYSSFAKGRWVGRKLEEVFGKEFIFDDPNYIRVAISLGRFFVNNIQVGLDCVLKDNDRIVHIKHRHEAEVLDLPIEVLAETEDLLVVSKPMSIPVHACGRYNVLTVVSLLRRLYGYKQSDLRSWIIKNLHRLDRMTSGVLLFARNYEADVRFKRKLEDGKWQKEYLCKVEGIFPTHSSDRELICDQPMGTLVSSMGIQYVFKGGKTARTRFKLEWTDGRYSIVRCFLETGRTHQIRVHLQFLGYPIVNDKLYNSNVWGPLKGKGCEYGKSHSQLVEDVKKSHSALIRCQEMTVDQEYTERIKNAVLMGDKLEKEPPDYSQLFRPKTDPYCLHCHTKPSPYDHDTMFLHCLKYETDDLSYSTALPQWAVR